MRTTIDLPDAVHARVKAYAQASQQSVTTVIAGLVAQGVDGLAQPPDLMIDPRSGFPVVSYGRPVTSAEVADLIDED